MIERQYEGESRIVEVAKMEYVRATPPGPNVNGDLFPEEDIFYGKI